MLCWMHDNEMHRGFLELPTGEPMTDLDIARRAGISIKETRTLLVCMERIGTYSKDARGCLLSRRMARDTHISGVRRQAAIKRASVVERAKHGEFAPAKPPAKPKQTPTVTASVSDSVSTIEEEPPKPPVNGTPANGCSPTGERAKNSQFELTAVSTIPLTNGALKAQQSRWFEAWWEIYWRKVSRKPAEKAFEKNVRSVERFDVVMAATRRQTVAMMAREPDHRPHGATWLNAERWEDAPSLPARASPGKGPSIDELAGMIGDFRRTR